MNMQMRSLAVLAAVAIGFGVIVAMLAWGLFAPIVSLMERLAVDIGRL